MKAQSQAGLITLKTINYSLFKVNYVFKVQGPSRNFIRNGVLTIKCNKKILLDQKELASIFYLSLAPLCWITGAEYCSDLPVNSEMADSIKNVGHYVCAYYGWNICDPLKYIEKFSASNTSQIKNALLFSGGVDSLSAFFQNEKNIDTLIQLSNFDYLNENLTSKQLKAGLNFGRAFAEKYGKQYLHIETNLAHIINHKLLDVYFPQDCTFWYGLQHINHLATCAAIVGSRFDKVFIAGSNSELHKQVGSCAAKSIFVNLYYPNSRFCLVEEQVSRQRKIEYLIDNKPECLKDLRVCYSSGLTVCNNCAKCQGTALMIIAGGLNIKDTAFSTNIYKELLFIAPVLKKTKGKYLLFEQSLLGRTLQGSRIERIDQLFKNIFHMYQHTKIKK